MVFAEFDIVRGWFGWTFARKRRTAVTKIEPVADDGPKRYYLSRVLAEEYLARAAEEKFMSADREERVTLENLRDALYPKSSRRRLS